MQIGDRLCLVPTVIGGKDLIDTGPQPCRVVYIHPQWRFLPLSFAMPLPARPGGK